MLMFLAASDTVQTIETIARNYAISKNHLMKVAQKLVADGYIISTRGRGGGLALARPASEINLGAVIRATEDTGNFVECFDPVTNQCVATPACGLKHILAGGVATFLNHFDQYSVADLMPNRTNFRAVLGLIDDQVIGNDIATLHRS